MNNNASVAVSSLLNACRILGASVWVYEGEQLCATEDALAIIENAINAALAAI
jgi:hypothetical protein